MKNSIKLFFGSIFIICLLSGIISCSVPETHVHTFSDVWSYDATKHWHVATCDDANVVDGMANHDWIELGHKDPTEWKSGYDEKKCKICDYVLRTELPALEHVHKFSTTWMVNASSHWHEAICGHGDSLVNDMGPHEWDESNIVIVDPTETEAGSKTSICKVCGHKSKTVIPALGHNHVRGTYHPAQNGKCNQYGNIEYYDCTNEKCFAKLNFYGAEIKSVQTSLNPDVHAGNTYTWIKTETTCKKIYDCCKKEYIAEAMHTFKVTSNNDATIEADGTLTKLCSRCSYKVIVTDTGSQLLHNIGDIILADGTVRTVTEYNSASDNAIAVIAVPKTIDGRNKTLCVGLKHGRNLAWCKEGTDGWGKTIDAIFGETYKDGPGAWEKIKAECTDAESNPELYPAWNYCLNYASENNLTGLGGSGWYIPTVNELKAIYINLQTVDESLKKASGDVLKIATAYGVYSIDYWSCCDGGWPYYAYSVNLLNGYSNKPGKQYDGASVCLVKIFEEEDLK